MALFDRWLNPDWHRIASFSLEIQHDVGVCVRVFDALAEVLRRDVVTCFASDIGSFGGPIAAQKAHTGVLQVVGTAFLSSCQGRSVKSVELRRLAPGRLMDFIGFLWVNPTDGAPLSTIAEAGYSNQPYEACTQMLVEIATLLRTGDFYFTRDFRRNVISSWQKAARTIFSMRIHREEDEATVKRSLQEMPPHRRRLFIMLAESLATKTNPKTAPAPASTQKPFDPVEYQKQHPLLFVPFPAIVALQRAVAADALASVSSLSISGYDLRRVSSAPADSDLAKLWKIVEVDASMYGYAAVAAAAARRESKFTGCGVWKKLTEIFERDALRGLALSAESLQDGTLGATDPNRQSARENPRMVVDLMSRVRRVPNAYLQEKPENPLALLGATAILKNIAHAPAWQPHVLAMVRRHLGFLDAEITKLSAGKLIVWEEQERLPMK